MQNNDSINLREDIAERGMLEDCELDELELDDICDSLREENDYIPDDG